MIERIILSELDIVVCSLYFVVCSTYYNLQWAVYKLYEGIAKNGYLLLLSDRQMGLHPMLLLYVFNSINSKSTTKISPKHRGMLQKSILGILPFKPKNIVVRTTNYKLQTTNYKLQTTEPGV